MKECKNCACQYDDAVKFCEKCGKELVTVASDDPSLQPSSSADAQPASAAQYCVQCGALLDEGVAFCQNCGTSVKLGALYNAQASSSVGDGVNNAGGTAQQEASSQNANSSQNGNASAQGSGTAYGAPDAIYRPSYDHTQEFDARDIAQNKLYAMLPYLFSLVGVIAAKLIKQDSAFLDFHVRQGVKFVIAETLLLVIGAVLFWTLIVPFVVGIMQMVLFVIQIIAFFSAANGQAREPAILRDLRFLK